MAPPETRTEYEYLVRLGGSPPDSAERYIDEESAWLVAERMAEEIAVERRARGIPVPPLGRYDEDADTEERETGGRSIGGVCPEDDDGGYWPYVVRREVA